VFACASGGGLLGVFIHRQLPPHHLSPESKDGVRLGMGLVATTVALVLGLLVAEKLRFSDRFVSGCGFSRTANDSKYVRALARVIISRAETEFFSSLLVASAKSFYDT